MTESSWGEPAFSPIIQVSQKGKPPEEQTYRIRPLKARDQLTRSTLYVLERVYASGSRRIVHKVFITRSLLNHLRHNPVDRVLLQSALFDLFRCLINWRLPPAVAPTLGYIYVDPDTSRPRVAIRVNIPRNAALNWQDFWTDLEQRVYQHITFGSILIFVRRIDYGPASIP